MAAVSSVLATWQFGAGAPGMTKLWFQELLDATARQAAVDSVRTLLNSLANALRSDWSIQVETTIQNFDLTTGDLSNEVSAGTKPGVINGIQNTTATYTGGVGARILWRTGVVIDGRKVVGRTFCVPFVSTAFTTGGLVAPTIITGVKTAIGTYVSQPSARPVVWHKKLDRSDPSKPPVYVGGNAVPINSGDMLAAASSLRSRRY